MSKTMRFWQLYGQKPQTKTYNEVYSRDKGIYFDLSLYLHPYFKYVRSKGSGYSASLSLCCSTMSYTQTKKKRPIFMVLYLSIQLRCCNKNKTKMLIKRPTHKKW